MRAECKSGVTWLANSQAIGICERVGWGHHSVGNVGVLEAHEEALGFEHVGVGTGLHLSLRSVKLEDLWVIGWESCGICQYYFPKSNTLMGFSYLWYAGLPVHSPQLTFCRIWPQPQEQRPGQLQHPVS